MAPRIRTLKPEIWQSEDFMGLSVVGRLAFIALITLADDEGRIKTSAGHLASAYLHDADEADVQAQLDRMAGNAMILQYTVEGRAYVQLQQWEDHQKVDHGKPSKLPPPAVRHSRGGANRRERSRSRVRARTGPDRTGPDRSRGAAAAPSPSARAHGRADAQEGAEQEPDTGAQEGSAPDGGSEGPAPEPGHAGQGHAPGHVQQGPAQQASGNGASAMPPLSEEAQAMLHTCAEESGRQQPYSPGECLKAEDIAASLQHMTPSHIQQRMQGHAAWCREEGRAVPRSVSGYYQTLRLENDYLADQGSTRSGTRTDGMTSIRDLLIDGGTTA